MKKISISLLLTAFCLILPFTGQAQEMINYLKADIEQPTSYNAPLSIQLERNDYLCESKYGDEDYRVCSPYVGDYGAKVFTIKTTPQIEGSWSWEDSSEITFRPAYNTQWQKNTRYTIQIDPITLPANVELDEYSYSFTTLPQAAQVYSQRFWTDTSAKANHIYSVNISFLYPIENKEEIQKNLSITPQSRNSTLKFGTPEYIWSRQDTRLTVNLPVKELAPRNTIVKISLSGMPAYFNEGRIKVSDRNLVQNADLPGSENLFHIKEAYLSLNYNKDLEQEFTLNVETSLQASTQEVYTALEVFALPKKSNEEANVVYEWDKAPVLDEGKLVKITPIDPTNISTKHTFKVQIEPETYANIVFDKSLTSHSGLTLPSQRNFVLYATAFQPEISFLQNGNILSVEGSTKIALQTSQLTEIKWQAYKIRKPYMSFIADSYFANRDIYYDDYGYDSSYTNYDELSEIVSGTIKIDGKGQANSELVYLNMQDLLANFKTAETSGLIRLELTGMQDDKVVTTTEKSFLLTDIGLLVKRNANGTRNVFAYSINNSKPLNAIEIQVLGENGVPLTTARTNANGMAVIDNVDGFTRDKEPTVLTAYNSKNNDYTFISMNNLMRTVETSRFDTQGRMQSLSNFQAYVFAERGLFRPGDKVSFGIIVRNSDNSVVQSLPVKAVLYNPQGVQIAEKSFNMEDVQYGIETLEWQSFDYSPTGTYRLEVISSNTTLGSRNIRLEEFQPNVLEIESEILPKKTKGWHVISAQNKFDLAVELTNLYGTAAQDRKVTANLSIYPTSNMYLNGYSNYTFTDPYSSYSSYSNAEINLPEATTNNEGKANFEIDLSAYTQSNRTYQASLYIEGFEPNGGRAVNTTNSFIFSPAEFLLGYKLTGGINELYYIPVNRKGSLEFIQVNSNLEQDKDFEYSFVLTKRKYVSNLVKNSQGELYYDETLVQEELSRQDLKSQNGTILWDIPTATPGEYIISVYEKESNFALAEVPFTVAGDDIVVNKQNIPSTIKLQLEKTNFNASEQVEAMLSLPYDGFGLITLEADKVLSHVWFEAKAGQSLHSIPIPKNYEGRAYVVVSFMKNTDSSDVYLSPYSHVIEPILVNIDKRKLNVEIEAPSLVKTSEDLKVKVKASAKTKAIIFAVDEGILALTNYKTPSPLNYFLVDRGLEVSTSQFLDLIMPEVSALAFEESMAIDEVMLKSAYGGGLAMAKQNLLNPFKRKAEPPLVYWSGLVDLDTKEKEISIPIPSYYNGNLRIMAVAVSEQAFGSADENTTIRRDVIISPQMPVMASPTDKVNAGVMLVNNTDAESDFELSVTTPNSLKITNKLPKTIKVQANDEVFVPVDFEVLNILGEASINFTVKTKELEVARQSSISIRPSTPYTTEVLFGVKNTAGTATLSPETPMYDYNAKAQFTASYTPNAFLQGYLTYLESVRYASSTEALISKAFPYVLMSDSPELLYANAKDPKLAEQEAKNAINEAIYAIRSNTNYNGLSMWYHSNSTNPLLTVYAGDFLIAFRKAGYSIPADIERPIFDSIRNIATQRPNNLSDARIAAYAIWVLTREGYITAQYIENLIDTMSNSSSDMRRWEKDLTAILLASSLKTMRYDMSDYDHFDFNFQNFKNSSFMNVFAAQSLFTRVLAHSFPEQLTSQRVNSVVSQSMTSFKSGQSTFSVAQALAALYALGSEENKQLPQSAISCDNADYTPLSLSNAIGISAPLCTEFTVNTDNTTPVYIQLTTSGYPLNPPTEISASNLNISKQLLNSRNEPITSVNVGDVVKVQIKANSHNTSIEDIVIQDLFAGAFEPILNENGVAPVEFSDNAQADIREDRATFYVTLTPEEKVYTYEVRAVNKGTFTVPAVYARSLYDNRIYANDVAQTIIVE